MAVNKALKPILCISRRLRSIVSASSRFKSGEQETNVLKSPAGSLEIPKISISEFVFNKIEKFGKLVATENPITGKKYTYDQIRKYSENLAGALRKKLKLDKGDVVAVLLPNCTEYPIVALGIVHGGMTATTMNPLYTPEEIGKQILDSGAKALITLNELFPVAKSAAVLTKTSFPILTISSKEGQTTPQGAINLLEIIQDSVDMSGIDKPSFEDIAFMPYSSGTTGLPKGVELTHHNIVANLSQLGMKNVNIFNEATNNDQDILPCILPTFHIYGLVVGNLQVIMKGGKQLPFSKFDPKLFVEVLSKHKPQVLFVVPSLFIFLTHDAVKVEYLSSVRCIISGASPLGATDEEQFLAKVKRDIHIGQGYGMTETSPAITVSEVIRKSTKGSTGPPLANTELKVVEINNPSAPALGANQTGELLVRGPQVMKGYHNKPKETEEAFQDGWLRTGDIAHYDQSGCLTITDRLKELIKVKGFQVPPAELEEVIRKHPDVVEVGVIGIPHERSGQVPRAYVVMKPGAKFDEENIKDFVKSKVASYKTLKGGVSVIDNIPKNASGKILRRQLIEYYDTQQKELKA